jgi:hypothetical protein
MGRAAHKYFFNQDFQPESHYDRANRGDENLNDKPLKLAA